MKIYCSRQKGKEGYLDRLLGKEVWAYADVDNSWYYIRVLSKSDHSGSVYYTINKLGESDIKSGYLNQAYIDLNKIMNREYTYSIKQIHVYYHDDDFDAFTTQEITDIIHGIEVR